jgi:hypothetical protein
MRPFPLEMAAGDFAFASGHRAISFLAGILNSAAVFSTASSGAFETRPADGFGGDLRPSHLIASVVFLVSSPCPQYRPAGMYERPRSSVCKAHGEG